MKSLTAFDWTVLALVIVGALNWGLVGLFRFDLVAAIFGDMTVLSRVVYAVVGIAALYLTASAGMLARKQN